MRMKEKNPQDRKLKNGVYIECIAEGCIKKANSNGYCWDHYNIWQKDVGEDLLRQESEN